ncbi:cytochrome c oxidase, subunit II [Kribbella flavida DSM 17836]|uniref:Cytochrome c oxidase subunit 2 n=1 Tax=Kribbella flavida (strain DSM 17836 / JCM 10339 / NBRC 14399) TaxID=479435 RepID=D2PZ51_KRIFD|nr:cytochrome c oxidase subunit II [Kribbella flavida]ADB31845.1 cytochrome c oxidase, subunit II [Kribbella flavida DSM 17836]
MGSNGTSGVVARAAGQQTRAAARPAKRRLLVAAAVVVSTLVLTGCSAETNAQWKRLGLPEGASDRTEAVRSLWIGAWIAALIIGVMVWGLILFAVVRYRRRSEDAPRQTRYNLPLEVLYTLAPFAVIGVLFFYTVENGNKVTAMSDSPAHTINVVGQQWQWTFNYKETVDGQEGVWETGTLEEPAELVLPVNESVKFELTSPDVIHSFWVPAFYFKLDVIPGRPNNFELTPTKTGTFAGKCAELCGLYHSRMVFTVRVVTAEEYQAHLRELAAKGQTGAATGGEDATTIPGHGEQEGEK